MSTEYTFISDIKPPTAHLKQQSTPIVHAQLPPPPPVHYLERPQRQYRPKPQKKIKYESDSEDESDSNSDSDSDSNSENDAPHPWHHYYGIIIIGLLVIILFNLIKLRKEIGGPIA